MNSVRASPLGNSFLILGPKLYKKSMGAAVPKAYPITAPRPPQVAADAGPNNIQAISHNDHAIFLEYRQLLCSS